MKTWNQRKTEAARRGVGIVMMISLLAGSVSIASFANGMEKTEGHWSFGAEVSQRRTKTGSARSETATPSGLSLQTATAANTVNGPPLEKLLEQTDDSGAIAAEWFRVKLDETVISDSNDYSRKLVNGTEIRPDAMVEHRLQVKIYPELGELGEDDSVMWNLGIVEGLDLPDVINEELELEGYNIGYVYLEYTEEGNLYLTTEFYDDIQKFSNITVTYWYESTFKPVEEEAVLEFDLPGYDEPGWAVLLPVEQPTTEEPTTGEPTAEEPTTEEPTTEEPTAEEPTTEEPTAEEPTTEEPTTEEPTTEEPTTKGSGTKKSSGGSSSVSSTSAAMASETTIAEESTTAVVETEESAEQTQAPTTAVLPESRSSPDRNAASGGGSEAEAVPAPEQQDDRQQETPPELNIVEVTSGKSRGQPGELIEYRVVIRNEGTAVMKDIRVRDYLPEYTSFVTVEDGSYGVINGKQHVTWMIDQLKPGEKKELVLAVRVFLCIPENHSIQNQIYWQADNKTPINNPENPSEVKALSEIIVG